MVEKCTNTSSPPSVGTIKPYPLALLNHLTVPCCMTDPPGFIHCRHYRQSPGSSLKNSFFNKLRCGTGTCRHFSNTLSVRKMKQSKNRAFCFVPDRSPNAAGARTRRSGRAEKEHGRNFL